jgi:hypothetical protein
MSLSVYRADFVFSSTCIKCTTTPVLWALELRSLLPKRPNHSTVSPSFLTWTWQLTISVVSQKDWKGMQPSTHLSAAFQEQGVRLRLRKETRALVGVKRSQAAMTPETRDDADELERLAVRRRPMTPDVQHTLGSTMETLTGMYQTGSVSQMPFQHFQIGVGAFQSYPSHWGYGGDQDGYPTSGGG